MKNSIADFRSDTVTKPTREMLDAMMRAEVGDDVLGDDPTVQRLEELAAEKLGKAAAVFVPSGTMGNQVSIAAQTKPGDEIILDENSHCIHYESGALGRIAGVQIRTLRGKNGVMDVQEIEAAIRAPIAFLPRTSLIEVEQSHMSSGGSVLPLEHLKAVRALAKKHKLRIHMDGARLFNASVASGVAAKDYAAQADSVTFCLSKGLSCPAGSMICGDADFIEEARRLRKMLGGAMRQSGYLAACGILALTKMVDRLSEDHEKTKKLATGFSSISGFSIDNPAVETNILFVSLKTKALNAAELQASLEKEGVRAIALGPNRIRFVVHREIEAEHVERAVSVVSKLMKGKS